MPCDESLSSNNFVSHAAFVSAASSAAWATTYPAYTCSEVVGIASGTQAKNATGESLMPNGSVYGEWIVPGTTVYSLQLVAHWKTLTEIDNAGSSLWASFGDAFGPNCRVACLPPSTSGMERRWC